jgi:hypothetical protein
MRTAVAIGLTPTSLQDGARVEVQLVSHFCSNPLWFEALVVHFELCVVLVYVRWLVVPI